jgi:hypothetical protein
MKYLQSMVLIISLMFSPLTTVATSNPTAPFTADDNIQDPGAPSAKAPNGCTHSDPNCYVLPTRNGVFDTLKVSNTTDVKDLNVINNGNITQTGIGTFSTGTGDVTINGLTNIKENTTLNKDLKVLGNTDLNTLVVGGITQFNNGLTVNTGLSKL